MLNNCGEIIKMAVKSYDELLLQTLRDPDEAAAYLTACYEDSLPVFLQGLRMVAEAHGGITALAEKTNLNRESLYRMLSEQGNPQLSSLAVILERLGLQITFAVVSD